MKKTTIHLVALLLALLMLTSVITGAFAEDATATPAPEEDTGIIDGAALKQWADSFAQEHKLDEAYKSFSIGFCYTGTGDSWYYDADQWVRRTVFYKVTASRPSTEAGTTEDSIEVKTETINITCAGNSFGDIISFSMRI